MNYNENPSGNHPCDICKYKGSYSMACNSGCAWYGHSEECINRDCMYNGGDAGCEMASKCGAFIGWKCGENDVQRDMREYEEWEAELEDDDEYEEE